MGSAVMSSILPLRCGTFSLSAAELGPRFLRPSDDCASVAFSVCDALRFLLLRLLGRRAGAFCAFSLKGGGALLTVPLLRRLRNGQIAMGGQVAGLKLASRAVHAPDFDPGRRGEVTCDERVTNGVWCQRSGMLSRFWWRKRCTRSGLSQAEVDSGAWTARKSRLIV